MPNYFILNNERHYFATATGFVARPLTAEETADQARRVVAYERELAREQCRQRVAQRKAERLLLEHLDADQHVEYRTHNRFTMTGSDGKTYRVYRGFTSNIQHIKTTKAGVVLVATLCVLSPGVPVEDNMLIQKLALETDARSLRRTAVVTRHDYLMEAAV